MLALMSTRLELICMVCAKLRGSPMVVLAFGLLVRNLEAFLSWGFSTKSLGNKMVGWCLKRAFQQYIEVCK